MYNISILHIMYQPYTQCHHSEETHAIVARLIAIRDFLESKMARGAISYTVQFSDVCKSHTRFLTFFPSLNTSSRMNPRLTRPNKTYEFACLFLLGMIFIPPFNVLCGVSSAFGIDIGPGDSDWAQQEGKVYHWGVGRVQGCEPTQSRFKTCEYEEIRLSAKSLHLAYNWIAARIGCAAFFISSKDEFQRGIVLSIEGEIKHIMGPKPECLMLNGGSEVRKLDSSRDCSTYCFSIP
ncbi:MAG: hypothetical protein NXY57DRAFT_1043071 [Lentinula lateritia]|nr:MAG: hypothetical protein NXY57DRAFT_1043071 [Lentinula lateritia]